MKLKRLTEAERRVMVNKATEPPGSGEYNDFFEAGRYICRRCGANLYRSENKFEAHCGWPSFDQEVLGAVERVADADGRRTEIVCARCQGHLGHVFEGEGLTAKNTRHCVNSLSLKFEKQEPARTQWAEAYFGGGCFWCTEAALLMIRGVKSVTPGYAGGTTKNPTYEAVCRGDTGHAEVIKVMYDPEIIAYEGLLDVFFASHDPTTLNRQGHDVGSQYRSIVLYQEDWQKEAAEHKIEGYNREMTFGHKVVTEVTQLEAFYKAEDYHHNYYAKNPDTGYCQVVIAPKLAKLRKTLKKYRS